MAAKHAQCPALQIGQPFNPFGLFVGIFIPDALVRTTGISAGAKLTYGRLARYAGQDGNCYPAVPTLASEIGMSARQTQNYLAELERSNLIRRTRRFAGRAQTSNAFQFLWHKLLEAGVKKTAPEGVQDPAPEGVKNPAPKESQIEEGQSKGTNRDTDCPTTNRTKRDSQSGVTKSAECKQYPHLRQMLARYMMSGPDDEVVYPSDRQVVDIMDSAGGASEDKVVLCLAYLRNERGLQPGTRNAPRTFSWFQTVVGDYFKRKREREEVANPVGFDEWSERNETRLSKAQFDSMTDAIEIDGSEWKTS
jgi:hypothetical protein